MQNEFEKRKHSVSIENRESIELTGVCDAPAFNEAEACIVTDYGDIMIKGENMKLEALDLESGVVRILGKITALVYNERSEVKGFFKRLIK